MHDRPDTKAPGLFSLIGNYILTCSTKLTDEEQKEKFKRMMDMLDEAQDVQDVYHNVKL